MLNAAGHKPPINAITVACGAGSMLAALVGTVSTCLTGPVNAIISASGSASAYTAALPWVSRWRSGCSRRCSRG